MSIVDFLIKAGCECGTKEDFRLDVLEGLRAGKTDRWFFRATPTFSGDGMTTVKLDMAFPFFKKPDEENNETALLHLEVERKQYKDDLLYLLRSNHFIVPPDLVSFTPIPFWAGESGYAEQKTDFGGMSIHIYNAVLTVKYRESWFNN